MPDYEAPVIIKKGATIENFANSIHKGLMREFRHALVWGTSVKHNPQTVGKDHVLADFSVYIVAFGGFCQVAGSMLAVFFISQCIETNREELMEDIKRNPDLAVLELDKLAAARLIKKNALVAWSTGKLPFCIRFMLVFAVILMSCSCYIFFM